MSENRARYPIAVMCRVLDVSPSGYYAWAKRPACERAAMDAALTAQIRAAHAASKGTYGAPRLQIDLADAGIHVSRKRVARLMRNAGLAGVTRRKRTVTTVRDGARQAPDLVNRDFTAARPNMLWVADITYIPTWAGFLYLAVVLDAFSRRIVGWSMATSLHRQVVLDALDMALRRRQPSGVIHHSDQGSPNILWVADITYIPTWAGFLYLAVVLDAFSRRIVGWSMASTLHRQVVLDALDMALWQRRPSGVIHHSDQGSQIYLDRVRQTLSRGGCSPLDGVGRRRLRQCDGGELRYARM